MMKRLLLFCTLAAALCACGRENLIGVSFPEPPIEIATNEDFGMGLINYFNIIRLPDGTYRMYFSANEESGIAEDEWAQNLYLAESADILPYLQEGENKLEVKVTNLWVNRMIGDRQRNVKPVTKVRRFYEAEDKLQPSGLLGPVRLLTY